MQQYLDTDPLSGAMSFFEHDESENRILIHQKTDVSEIIENNKRLQNDGTGGWTSKDRDFRRVASIPIALVELWCSLYGVNPLAKENYGLLNRLLNDPDLRYLRTAEWQF